MIKLFVQKEVKSPNMNNWFSNSKEKGYTDIWLEQSLRSNRQKEFLFDINIKRKTLAVNQCYYHYLLEADHAQLKRWKDHCLKLQSIHFDAAYCTFLFFITYVNLNLVLLEGTPRMQFLQKLPKIYSNLRKILQGRILTQSLITCPRSVLQKHFNYCSGISAMISL